MLLVMYFKKLCQARRSAHNFAPGFKLNQDQWYELLECVRYTPSGYNAQPWQFQLLQSEEAIVALHEICLHQEIIKTAGNVVVVIGDVNFGQNESERIVAEWQAYGDLTPEKAAGLKSSLQKERETWKKREMVIRNASLAAMTFLYAAEDLGLAACPMMGVRQLDLKKYLGLAEHEIPIIVIAVGEPGGSEGERLPRKTVQEIERR